MKIQEALASGKIYRRKKWGGNWEECDPWYGPEQANELNLSAEDILADDWELKPDEPEYVVWNTSALESLAHRVKCTLMPELPKNVRVIDERLVEKLVRALERYDMYAATGVPKFPRWAEEALALYRKHVPKCDQKK